MDKRARKAKILQINYGMNQGGAETWLVNMMRLIDRKKYDVDFLLHVIEPCVLCNEIKALDARIFSCGTLKNPLRYSLKFIQTIKNAGPFHIIHTHSGILGALDIFLAKIAGVPIRVVHSRSDLDGMGSSIFLRTYRIIARWIIRKFATNSLGVSTKALSSIIGETRNKDLWSEVLPSGTDLDRFRKRKTRDDIRASLSIPSNSPVIGHIGNFRTPKNHSFFISIAYHLKKILPESLFILVGEGPLVEKVKTKVKILGLEESFIFTGRRDDSPALLSIMDCFLFPSLWEGFPQALIEAQAAGLHCVISSVIVDEAILIPSLVQKMKLNQNHSMWAKAVVRAVDAPSIDPEIAVASIENTRGDVTVSIRKLVKMYSEMLLVWKNRDYASM